MKVYLVKLKILDESLCKENNKIIDIIKYFSEIGKINIINIGINNISGLQKKTPHSKFFI